MATAAEINAVKEKEKLEKLIANLFCVKMN